jgi:hypothetical protein
VTGVVALLRILAGAERKRSRYSLGVIPIDRRKARRINSAAVSATPKLSAVWQVSVGARKLSMKRSQRVPTDRTFA